MDSPKNTNKTDSSNSRSLLLAVMAGQVGIITLVVIMAAVLGGLALDRLLNTKPWITIGLLVVSVPISIILMVFVARKTVAKIKAQSPNTPHPEEDEIGKDS
ncbi:MAG: AtpZ/AtpI family protein [Anaerolineaceae bacterium]